MKRLRQQLSDRATDPAGRHWIYVAYDQLSDQLGLLARRDPKELGIVLVETPWKAARRPYHRQKLATLLASQRHFAVEQAERGVALRYVTGVGSYAQTLTPVIDELGPLAMLKPAERELRADLASLCAQGKLETMEHDGFLTTRVQFAASGPADGPWRMDAFYRRVRRDSVRSATRHGPRYGLGGLRRGMLGP